jgi:hypothetical protein
MDFCMNIPNLPVAPMVDKDGNATDVELTFRQNLITALQQGAGQEGNVPATLETDSSQTASQKLTTIQNNQNAQGQYTCALGTTLYVVVDPLDYTQDKVVMAVRNTNDYPNSAPIFKTVTLT